MHFEAESDELDIKRLKPGILFISLQVGSFFKLPIMTYQFSCQYKVNEVIQKVQRHDDLI